MEGPPLPPDYEGFPQDVMLAGTSCYFYTPYRCEFAVDGYSYTCSLFNGRFTVSEPVKNIESYDVGTPLPIGAHRIKQITDTIFERMQHHAESDAMAMERNEDVLSPDGVPVDPDENPQAK